MHCDVMRYDALCCAVTCCVLMYCDAALGFLGTTDLRVDAFWILKVIMSGRGFWYRL
jgi:hypothetical protein